MTWLLGLQAAKASGIAMNRRRESKVGVLKACPFPKFSDVVCDSAGFFQALYGHFLKIALAVRTKFSVAKARNAFGDNNINIEGLNCGQHKATQRAKCSDNGGTTAV